MQIFLIAFKGESRNLKRGPQLAIPRLKCAPSSLHLLLIFIVLFYLLLGVSVCSRISSGLNVTFSLSVRTSLCIFSFIFPLESYFMS